MFLQLKMSDSERGEFHTNFLNFIFIILLTFSIFNRGFYGKLLFYTVF